MNRLPHEIRYACRTLAKSPAFTFGAIATLALCLGANTAIFSFVNAVLLEPSPYPEHSRIVTMHESPPRGGNGMMSSLNYLDYRQQNDVFDLMAGVAPTAVSMTGVGEPVRLFASRVSAQHFDIVGVNAALGRTFVEGEDQAGRDHVAVLSHTLWQSQFGGDPAVIDRSIILDGEAYTVIGVLPANTPFERWRTRIWVPLTFTPENMTREQRWFFAIALLKPGVSLEQARVRLGAIAQRIANDHPDSNRGWGVSIEQSNIPEGLKRQLYVLFAAVGIVLLIACGNLANLSLMRLARREREIGIRIALGARRWALARQFLTESLVISLAGGALGVAVGYVAMTVFQALAPPYSLPPEADVRLDGLVLLFSLALAVLTGVVIGLVPALRAARPHVMTSLKQSGVGAGGGGSHARIRSALVIAQVAFTLMLLTGAGLLIRSLDKLSQVDLGFNPTNVLTFELPVSPRRFPDADALLAFYREVSVRLRALPGVTDVALTSVLPMRGWPYARQFQIAGEESTNPANQRVCFFKPVSPSYFRTLQMSIREGRPLADSDRANTTPVVVINETLATRYFPNTNPLGAHILIPTGGPDRPESTGESGWEVVGVVADEKVTGPENTFAIPGMYVPTEQSPIYVQSVLIRSSIDSAALRAAVVATVHAISPDQVVADLRTLDAIKSELLGNNRYRAILLGAFAGLALLLAAVGIYSVLSYSVAQRTREIGIRTALGATRGNIVRLVLRYGLSLTGVGLLLGLGGALAAAQLLTSFLFGISGRDPLTLVVTSGVLSLVALAACLSPARRATKVDPVIALRTE